MMNMSTREALDCAITALKIPTGDPFLDRENADAAETLSALINQQGCKALTPDNIETLPELIYILVFG